MGDRPIARCSFCGKRRDQVKTLVAGPGVYICDRCVALCQEVINEEHTPPASGSSQSVYSGGGPDRWFTRLIRGRRSRRSGRSGYTPIR